MVLLFNLGTSRFITRNLNDNSSNLFFFLNKLLFLIINIKTLDIFSINFDLVK